LASRVSITGSAMTYCSSVEGLRCVDGSSLTVIPVPSRDRGGTPYEVTLELVRDGVRFGSVGERCGYHLASLAARVVAARAADSARAALWPDPDDRFPDPPLSHAVRTPAGEGRDCGHADALRGWSPREPELFAFRHRDRGDLGGIGELRCTLRTSSLWVARPEPPRARAASGGRGRWRLARRAVIEAWGEGGWGVRAILTSGELEGFLADLLVAAELAGANYRDIVDSPAIQRHGR
jgi:hypothetical protein